MNDIPHQTYMSVQEQARAIYDAYSNGNKSTARSMFGQVLETRKALVTVFLLEWATGDNFLNSIRRFIVSVTK